MRDWYDYLCDDGGNNRPVAHSYIARLAAVMTFMRSMMLASPIASAGAMFFIDDYKNGLVTAGVIAAMFIAPFGFLYLAHETYKVLCRTRRELSARRNRRLRQRLAEGETSARAAKS